MPVETFNILLECFFPYVYPISYSKFMGSGIQITVKANELSLVMTVYRHGFHNGAIAYVLQIAESTT